MAQASGAYTTPRMRSTVSGSPSTGGNTDRRPLPMATKATNTIRIAEMFSTTVRPSIVPLLMASMELSYFSSEP